MLAAKPGNFKGFRVVMVMGLGWTAADSAGFFLNHAEPDGGHHHRCCAVQEQTPRRFSVAPLILKSLLPHLWVASALLERAGIDVSNALPILLAVHAHVVQMLRGGLPATEIGKASRTNTWSSRVLFRAVFAFRSKAVMLTGTLVEVADCLRAAALETSFVVDGERTMSHGPSLA